MQYMQVYYYVFKSGGYTDAVDVILLRILLQVFIAIYTDILTYGKVCFTIDIAIISTTIAPPNLHTFQPNLYLPSPTSQLP